MAEKQIVYIGAEHIHSHADNPRKNLGDLSELADSIKKNGILQNLTVIPAEEPGEYTVLIGHRRLAAGKMAGVTEFPCQIAEGLSDREQMSIMLEENMQRNDLTIWEQANGFQMMLDLGETEQSIAEKTGFSKSTVRHRLNIAKLDQNKLKEKEDSDGFQLSLTDLYELEKVEDIEARNRILSKATDSRNLAFLARQEVEKAKKEKTRNSYIEMLEKLGVKPAPDGAQYELYTGKWENVKEFKFDDQYKILKLDDAGGLFYVERYYGIVVIRKADKEKVEPTEKELEQKRKDRNRKEVREIWKAMREARRNFIEDIISGKVAPVKNESEIKDELFTLLMDNSACIGLNRLMYFYHGRDMYKLEEEDTNKTKEKIKGMSILHQLLCMASAEVDENDPIDWKNYYLERKGEINMRFYDILRLYGFSLTDGREKSVFDGTSELYERKEDNDGE